MDAVKFMDEWERMMETDPKAYAEAAKNNTNHGLVDYVERWSKAYLQKTRLQDFLEKYPNASLQEDGTPKSCGALLGYCKNCEESKNNCKTCWNQPIE